MIFETKGPRERPGRSGEEKMFLRKLMSLPVIAICTGVIGAGSASAQPLMRIQDYPSSVLNLPHWVMIEGGFCEKHGIKCESVPIPSGPVGLQALAAGSIEVSWSS